MFEIGMDRRLRRNCAGMSRRDFVRVGALGAFGLSLPGVLSSEAQAAAAGTPSKDVNVILIWLDGGPSHIDMFDPKPEAPVEIRGEFGAIETNVKGVRISDQLPNLAKQMDKYSILRINSPDSSHGTGNHYFLTGWKFTPAITYPAFGSIFAKEKGFRNGMPPYAIVGGVGQYTGGGYLGAVYNPFNVGGDPNTDGFSVKDVTPPGGVNMDRVSRRRGVLDLVDQFQRDAELSQRGVQAVNQFYSRAFDLVTSPVAKKAFSIKEEDAKLRDKYGRNSFGQGCLLARRLIEAGTRFVHIQKNGWDTHTSNFETLKKSRLPELDQGYAALLEDLADRGMLSNTVVICAGEFGRTPKVNSSAGRDHWGPASFATIGGGGIKTGIVVGETDAIAEYTSDRPVKVEDMAETLWKALGINTEMMLESNDGRPVRVADGGSVIHELV
jgi:uncharacterized protein (DUF1501 family)